VQEADLALPEGRIVAGLIPLHPAEDSSRDHFLLRHLAEVLPAHGVAVLRYDRRPAKDGHDVPLALQAEDARTAMAELRRLTGSAELPVGVWGFSQGGWAAMLAAPEASFLVTVSAAAVSPAEQMRYGTRRQLIEAGYGDDELGQLDELRAAFEDYLRGVRSREELQPLVASAAEAPWFELAWVPRELPEPDHWPDMDFDPGKALGRLHCPVLAFFGEEDGWVPVDASIDRFRSAAERAENSLTVTRLPGTTHEPVLAASGAVSPVYEQTLVSWLKGSDPLSVVEG
jgi:pimeloyl-ACP methyl ester carboxylesterase